MSLLRRSGLPPAPPLVDLPLHAAPAAEDTPFLRPKSRTRVRRAHRGWVGRTVLALELGGALVFALAATWAGYSKVMASERLKVARVDVRGSRFLSEGEVRELLGPALGENILGLDIEEIKQRLRASPWVADATVRRALPDTLQVEVRERVPLALAEVDRLYLMDEGGVLIDIYGPRTAGFDLPIVRDLGGFDDEGRRGRAERAGALLADLGALAGEISEVEVLGSGDLRVVLRGAGEVVLVGSPPYRQRFETFLALRRDLAERCPRAEYFDLRFRGRIYAKQPLDEAPKAVTPVARDRAGPNVAFAPGGR
ncbi:MAG: FtsQ-type POTRA domain-containing protein [Acidobacteria bacterium]|nr:FtsQ-type POTRA domain-containing protein [Acidobacteriota bacterium]